MKNIVFLTTGSQCPPGMEQYKELDGKNRFVKISNDDNVGGGDKMVINNTPYEVKKTSETAQTHEGSINALAPCIPNSNNTNRCIEVKYPENSSITSEEAFLPKYINFLPCKFKDR